MTPKEENAILRQLIADCTAAIGNGSRVSVNASLDFLQNTPAEIAAEIAHLKKFIPVWTDVADGLPPVGVPVLLEWNGVVQKAAAEYYHDAGFFNDQDHWDFADDVDPLPIGEGKQRWAPWPSAPSP